MTKLSKAILLLFFLIGGVATSAELTYQYNLNKEKVKGRTAVGDVIVIKEALVFPKVYTDHNAYPLVKYTVTDYIACHFAISALNLNTALGSFGMNMGIGTTTSSGHKSLASTSTDSIMSSLYTPTSSPYLISLSGTAYPGDITPTVGTFTGIGTSLTPLVPGDIVIVWTDNSGATSTDSLNAKGGFTGSGNLAMYCIRTSN